MVLVVGVVILGSGRSFDEGRSSAYASAISRFTESPILGTGPGTYGVLRMADAVDAPGNLVFPDAHNIPLNTAAESGIVGLAALILTGVLLALGVRQAWRSGSADRLVIAGALFGLAIFIGHGMVDVVFGLIGNMILALAVAALALTNDGPVDAATIPFGRTRPNRARRGLRGRPSGLGGDDQDRVDVPNDHRRGQRPGRRSDGGDIAGRPGHRIQPGSRPRMVGPDARGRRNE